MVVFSSLTPHCTGSNRTDQVRKAYIVQYAPDGAEVLQTAAAQLRSGSAPMHRIEQFEILRGGRRVV